MDLNLSKVSSTDPILLKVTPEYVFDEDSAKRNQIEELMFAIMFANNGIGLAAPQVGLSQRFFIMQTQAGEQLACYNPEILDFSEEVEAESEGCLSFPLLYLTVKRPMQITGKFQNTTGETVVQSLSGIDARCFLHELDHLNGIVFTSKVGSASLQIAKQRQSKLARKLNK
jgi:peptide deformylase